MIGIDIASVDANKPVDWAAARAAGVRFAYFRADYSTWADPTWPLEIGRARAAGITCGPYMMPAYAIGAPSPAAQVLALRTAVGLLGPSYLPPALDVEFSSIAATGRTRKQLLELVVEYVRLLTETFGCAPMIYTSCRVWDGEDADCLDADASGMDLSSVHECPLWLARYPWPSGVLPQTSHFDALPMPPVPRAWGDAGDVWIHQAQGDSRGEPGFSSTVDLNRFFALREGAKGDRVKWAQARLGMQHPTGVFDATTTAAVQLLQRAHELDDDGVVGPVTFSYLAWAR